MMLGSVLWLATPAMPPPPKVTVPDCAAAEARGCCAGLAPGLAEARRASGSCWGFCPKPEAAPPGVMPGCPGVVCPGVVCAGVVCAGEEDPPKPDAPDSN